MEDVVRPSGAEQVDSSRRDRRSQRSQEWVDYERVAALYEEGRALPAQVLARWREAVRPYLPSSPRRILDLGAGTGIFAREWPSWVSAEVVAVEPSAAMVLAGNHADPGVRFIRGDSEPTPSRIFERGDANRIPAHPHAAPEAIGGVGFTSARRTRRSSFRLARG